MPVRTRCSRAAWAAAITKVWRSEGRLSPSLRLRATSTALSFAPLALPELPASAALCAGTSAPSSITSNQVFLPGGNGVFNVVPREIFLPAGQGLYAIASAGTAGNLNVTYDIL